MFHRKSTVYFIVLALMAAMVLSFGCQKKGEEISLDGVQQDISEEVPMPTVPSKIMVPEEIAAKWKAVVLEVTDKDTNEKTSYTLNIGETSPIGSTGLTVFVEAFLPSFQMAGDVFTSSSPDLNNPAAKVVIKDETGAELYNRWLFSLYPATHPFEHQRYAIILTDSVAN